MEKTELLHAAHASSTARPRDGDGEKRPEPFNLIERFRTRHIDTRMANVPMHGED